MANGVVDGPLGIGALLSPHPAKSARPEMSKIMSMVIREVLACHSTPRFADESRRHPTLPVPRVDDILICSAHPRHEPVTTSTTTTDLGHRTR